MSGKFPEPNCYCDDEAKTQILEKLEEFSAGGIYFIDSLAIIII